ncbi:MAG: hypothetical protein IPQ05_23330 [Leptospiraceae bacterium]|nr:hypothetical protein [Leptospiraceae bacterium]
MQKKSLLISYLLWCIMLHRIYLYGFFRSLPYYITFGYFFYGVIWDFFTMSSQVNKINSSINNTDNNNINEDIVSPQVMVENQNKNEFTIIDCSECNGYGQFICGQCEGKKKVVCEEGWLSGCGGSGRRKCDRCKGKGIYREFIHVEDPCSRCHGRGEMRCNICNATGYVSCKKCKAKGKVPCAECHGNGKVKVYVQD